jgi:hypothetical protein
MFRYVTLERRMDAIILCVRCGRWPTGALDWLQPEVAAMHSHTGRPSIAPEKLLRALLLQVLYGVPSESKRMERLLAAAVGETSKRDLLSEEHQPAAGDCQARRKGSECNHATRFDRRHGTRLCI